MGNGGGGKLTAGRIIETFIANVHTCRICLHDRAMILVAAPERNQVTRLDTFDLDFHTVGVFALKICSVEIAYAPTTADCACAKEGAITTVATISAMLARWGFRFLANLFLGSISALLLNPIKSGVASRLLSMHAAPTW